MVSKWILMLSGFSNCCSMKACGVVDRMLTDFLMEPVMPSDAATSNGAQSQKWSPTKRGMETRYETESAKRGQAIKNVLYLASKRALRRKL